MCGIIGSYPGCGVKTDYLLHRGPDGSGKEILSNVTLGHTRLAILDLSEHGAQPTYSSDGNVILTYNGEIYNYRSLGNIYETCDSVSLAEWLSREGLKFNLAHLDGMYAFAAYFIKEESLILCRDAVGIKPLYIAVSRDHRYLAFSSEIKGFFGIDWFIPEPNMDKKIQSEFLQYGCAFKRTIKFKFFNHNALIPLIPTLLERVYQVCPGQKIIFSLNKKPISTFINIERISADPGAVLQDSIKSQSISDVEVGVQMSGGVDSSLVAWQYAIKNHSTKGFYVSVKDNNLNEDKWAYHAANTVAKICNFSFHQIDATQQEFSRVLPSVFWYMDEPAIRHPNAVGVYLLCEYVKNKTKVKVLLTGEGADEVFGGYEWHDGKNIRDYDRSRRLFDFGGSKPARIFLNMNRDKSILARQLLYDRVVYLPPILARQDRMSMAHSIESRVPFLSNGFLSMVAPLEPGKRILKKQAAKVFGKEFAERKKCGFGFPPAWINEVPIPKNSLNWLKFRLKPKTQLQHWTLAAIGMWAVDYLHGGWKDKIQHDGSDKVLENVLSS